MAKESKLKPTLSTAICVLFLTGCAQLDSILYTPTQTPESWLSIQPFIKLQAFSETIYLIQPTTTAFVYLLGLLTIAAGVYFLRIRNHQKSRLWWGIALILWGIGALLAGTSYEAFSYAIKCAGREACIWTSWWEICYLILSVGSVDAMLIAQSYACASGKWRKLGIGYAVFNFSAYLITALVGALIPIKFLISFEFLILALAPNIAVFLILNGRRYTLLKRKMDLALLGTWIWLLVTIGAYFSYYLSGLTQKLWARGIWFSENDVLHIGLIIWIIYIILVVAHRVEDEQKSPIYPPFAHRD